MDPCCVAHRLRAIQPHTGVRSYYLTITCGAGLALWSYAYALERRREALVRLLDLGAQKVTMGHGGDRECSRQTLDANLTLCRIIIIWRFGGIAAVYIATGALSDGF